jgi:hypothetical protein
MATAPSSWPTRRRSWRRSWANGGPINGSRLASSARWAGQSAASGLSGPFDPPRPIRHRRRRRRVRAGHEGPAQTRLRHWATTRRARRKHAKTYEADLNRRLDRLLRLNPTDKAGRQIQIIIRKVRRHLFVFVTNRDLEATNNGSERALRPGAVYRKITNGFRNEWAAKLYADIRSVVETARRPSIRAIDAIRLTLQEKSNPSPRNQPTAGEQLPSNTMRIFSSAEKC